MQYRGDIQGLRALAVVFVFVFHLSSVILPGGFIGVDMFFVISGYLITKISQYKIEKGKFSIKDFYLARIKRIVPSYYFLLICLWIIFLFVFAPSDVGKFKFSHFWSFIFNSNSYFANLDDYFGASSSENPFLHTWTLSIEMQFYFILPFLLIIFRNAKHLLWVILILIIVLIGYSSFLIYSGHKSEMYFSLFARTPEFLIGVVAAILKLEEREIIKKYRTYISYIGLIGLFISLILLSENSAFPGLLALLPCFSTTFLLISPESQLNKFLSNRVLFFIGEISYSVYLWHWPLMAFYRYSTERSNFTISESLLLISLTIICSLFSYYLIEKPFRKANKFNLFIPLSVLIVVNVLLVYFTVPIKRKFSNIPKEYIYPIMGIDSHGKDFKEVGIIGDSTFQEKQILFLGDSHALTFKPYLDIIGKKHSLGFRTITNDEYPAIPYLDKEITEQYRKIIYNKLSPYINSEIKNADVIIVYFARSGSRWVESLEKMIKSLNMSQRLLILSDYPVLDKNPVRINKSFIKNKDKNQIYELTYSKINPEILKLIEGRQNVRFVDFSKFKGFFKDAPFYRDTLMYYDSSHLNSFGVKRYESVSGELFLENLNWALMRTD